MKIKFGTSGWRAIIAQDFTFDNVERVAKAVCGYLKTQPELGTTLIIGNDTRFMGERFGSVAAAIAKAKGFRVLHCNHPVPTPTISHAIRYMKAAGALNFTASHNPPEYQGIKFSTYDGAPALPDVTQLIEKAVENNDEPPDADGGGIEAFDPKEAYLGDLKAKVNFEAIARSNAKFAYDCLYGTGRGYLDKILLDHGLEIETIHDWRDVTFGGRSPEPGEDHLDELRHAVTSKGLTLGLATDGDGDRFGIIDSDGTFIEPNKLVALLSDYLAESRGWTLGLARSVATSHLIDRVAKDRGLELHETPVGFKFIGELINRDKIILGGEESAGLSIRGHYPEKDGLIACLLAAEAVAARGKSIGEQLDDLYERTGRLESKRIGVKLTDDVAARLKEKLSQEPDEIGKRKIDNINRLDGVKFIFADGTWMLMRPSGTEPMVRIYAEAESNQQVDELLEAGRNYLLG